VLSINRGNPSGVVTSDSSVTYTVTFNEPVSGVDPTDFSLALTGSVAASPPVVVSGSGAVYAVTINGISGLGTLGLNLVDDGSIRDAAGNPLQSTATAYFPVQATIAVGANPDWIITADVNGDGKADLIVANRDDNSISVFLGNGNGTFASQITFAVTAPYFVAAADVNGDGNVDLLTVAFQRGDGVSVLLGNGNGTFQPPAAFATAQWPTSVTVADVNGDGKPDLLVTDYTDIGIASCVSVLLGNGNGTFQPQVTYATPAWPSRVVAADVNGDGKPDLIVSSGQGDSFGILLGNGDGTFQPQRNILTYFYTCAIDVSDVNGDGRPDLVLAATGGFLSIFLGNGDGTFQGPMVFRPNDGINSMAVMDVNGDGRADLVTAGFDGSAFGLRIMLGNGDGTFQPAVSFFTAAFPTSAVAAADFNGDGRPDLAVAYAAANAIGVLLAPSDGGLAGQVYAISGLDTINGTADTDYITLVQDADHQHIDWFLSSNTKTSVGQLAINDPNGLTINGISDGGAGGDQIFLDYSNGNPLPNIVHLNEPQALGDFVINGLSGSDPLSTTTLDIEKSRIFLDYAGLPNDPIALVRPWLTNGYNGGAWNGSGDAIVSSAAAVNNGYMVGYVDAADGTKINPAPDTIELMYTLGGDLTLAGTVGPGDFATVVANYGKPAAWDTGAITYGQTVSFADFALTVANYGSRR
jgi:hypothetical protein